MKAGDGFWSTFTLHRWYKLVCGLSALTFLAALTIRLQFPNGPVAIAALGAFLIGLGEWTNQRNVIVNERVPGGIARIRGTKRENCIGGILLDVLGALMLVYGLYRLFA